MAYYFNIGKTLLRDFTLVFFHRIHLTYFIIYRPLTNNYLYDFEQFVIKINIFNHCLEDIRKKKLDLLTFLYIYILQ